MSTVLLFKRIVRPKMSSFTHAHVVSKLYDSFSEENKIFFDGYLGYDKSELGLRLSSYKLTKTLFKLFI